MTVQSAAKKASNSAKITTRGVQKVWQAGWSEVGGCRVYFRSKWERNYAFYLEWLRSRREIKHWEYEKTTFWFDKPMTVGGRKLTGVRRGVNSYKPDFLVVESNGLEAFHEVKGYYDQRSRTTIDRMRRYYPNVRLVIIDERQYSSIAKVAAGLVPGWE